MIRSMQRYVSADVAPGSRTASSAAVTCGACASGSEKTATVLMPMPEAVAKTRRAISPRLATRSFFTLSPSHPEDAEPAAPFHDIVVDGGQRDAQHRTGVARIDDPVVENLAAQEHRPRLPIDLILDELPRLRVGLLVEGS